MSAEDRPHACDHARILVAEDAPTQAELTRFTLEDAGFEVRLASDGLAALRQATEWRPDLVLSDVMMPGLGGYDLCRALKAAPATKSIPVVLLTSLSEAEDVVEGLECGADHFITKPFEEGSLIERIRETLDSMRAAALPDGGEVEIAFAGRPHVITADRRRILRMLLSTFETVAKRNKELQRASREAQELAATLEQKVRERTAAERKAIEELTEANRVKDEFLAVVSHELRTPLTPLLGWTRLLRSGELAATRYPEIFAVLERNLQAQAHIINDLLDVSRIVSGKVTLDLADLPLEPAVRSATESLRPTARNKGVELRYLGSGGGPDIQVNADSARLHQIVWNLVSNAVKFTAQGGVVTVRIDERDDDAILEVEDTGIGIDPHFLPHVFDRFRQASMGVTRRFGGLGLGLSIVKHLVEIHGGTIVAESEGQDRGSRFVVTFPASHVAARTVGSSATLPSRARDRTEHTVGSESAAPPEPVTPVTPVAAPLMPVPAPAALQSKAAPLPGASLVASREVRTEEPLSGMRILVVDDDEDTRDFISALLSFAGARVTSVADGLEARAVLSGEDFDLIVSDLSMPGEDGFSLIEKVRAGGGANRATPAIALTAHVRPEDARRAMAAGFQAHMIKPPKREGLIARAAELARRQGSPGHGPLGSHATQSGHGGLGGHGGHRL